MVSSKRKEDYNMARQKYQYNFKELDRLSKKAKQAWKDYQDRKPGATMFWEQAYEEYMTYSNNLKKERGW